MQPQGPYVPNPAPSSLPPGYEFMASTPPPKRASSVPSSMIMRVVIVVVGLIVLLILFSVIKGIFSGGSNKPQLLSVAQDQQELIHLTTNALLVQTLSTSSKNAAITTQLSITSEQSQLLHYMVKTGIKVNAKQLSLKLSLATDKELTDAAAASSYDATLKTILQTKLGVYQKDLKQAYAKTSGPKGRELLKGDYDGAGLLLIQLDSPAN